MQKICNKSQICNQKKKLFYIFSEYQKPFSNCLREVTVPIVGFEECQEMYENDPSRIKVLKGMKYTIHSLIRGVLIQSCPAGAKNFTNYMYFVMYNSVVLSKILKIIVALE